jgi:hypothetical protein
MISVWRIYNNSISPYHWQRKTMMCLWNLFHGREFYIFSVTFLCFRLRRPFYEKTIFIGNSFSYDRKIVTSFVFWIIGVDAGQVPRDHLKRNNIAGLPKLFDELPPNKRDQVENYSILTLIESFSTSVFLFSAIYVVRHKIKLCNSRIFRSCINFFISKLLIYKRVIDIHKIISAFLCIFLEVCRVNSLKQKLTKESMCKIFYNSYCIQWFYP